MKYFVVFAFLLSACSAGGPFSADWNGTSNSSSGSNAGLDVGVQQQALAILQVNCSSCHTSSAGPNDVYGFDNVNHMISAGLIIPGHPESSPIYMMVSAGLMPPGRVLSSDDQNVLYKWILGVSKKDESHSE